MRPGSEDRLIRNRYSDYDSISTFNETGAVNFTDKLGEYEDAYSTLEQDAGYILSQNLQDRSTRSGLSLAGWKPKKDAAAQAVEWWEFDWEYAFSPVSHPFIWHEIVTLTPSRSKVLKNSP